MNSIEVAKVSLFEFKIANIQQVFSDLSLHNIAYNNWPEQYPYTPKAAFKIAHDDKHILLHYQVEEEFVKATHVKSNQGVYEDSCIEFFLSLDDKQTYFNIEFNVLGTGLIGFGSQIKSERKRLADDLIDQVNSYTLSSKVDGKKNWEIYLIIPLSILNIGNLSGKHAHANFYKCGDGLPQPHFLSWNPITFHKPNFHLPEFFGEIYFK